MSVQVTKKVIVHTGLKSALAKIYVQNLKKAVDRYSLMKIVKVYDAEINDVLEVLKKYQLDTDESKLNVEEFLNSTIEFPSISSAILEQDDLDLSAQDLFFLEHFISK